MLIIFDLDDTLVDTTGCLTHFLLKDALSKLHQEGWLLPDTALSELCALNLKSKSAKEALEIFVKKYRGNEEMLKQALSVMHGFDEVPYTLEPLEGATKVLEILSSQHTVCLVTIGHSPLQMDKLKKAGIDSTLFSKILVSEKENKGDLYRSLLDEFECSGKEVIVCGDRISRDLTPAKRHGCQTVLMRWGRGLQAELPHEDVDREISSLSELLAYEV